MLTQPARYGDKRFVYHINYTREKLMKLIRMLREKHPKVTIITKTNEWALRNGILIKHKNYENKTTMIESEEKKKRKPQI